MRAFFTFIFLIYCSIDLVLGQECNDFADFNPSGNGQINWDKFPEFDLPFKLIFGGEIHNGNAGGPLNHGFSHITDSRYLTSVPFANRALIYYGVAYPNQNQPWELERSPWGNDLGIYQQKWNSDFMNFANSLGNGNFIDSDIFMFDIERVWRFDHEILQFKNSDIVPDFYKELPILDFISTYKKDNRDLYAKAVSDFLKNGKHPDTKISSYADAPVFNTFSNIQGKSWDEWVQDSDHVNFITKDDNGNVGGPFYEQMDFMSPSAYYYYDYPHPFAGEYLSYMMFQIEANKAWTTKPVIPFLWLKYSANPDLVNQSIRPWMAEATAIFPFFSGADGLWLWENPTLIGTQTDFEAYEYFNKGLYRFSQFKSFFEGSYELVQETSARDYNENKQPIWRGAVKGNEILIAAHNPFAADENEEVTIGVAYQNWSGTVTLKGYEVFLCKFDMSTLGNTLEEPLMVVYPNPTSDRLKAKFDSNFAGSAVVNLIGAKGEVLKEEFHQVAKGLNEIELDVSNIQANQFFLQIKIKNQSFSKKVIKW
ncbi:T9SS type A sorting domain-containing protein [Arcticibacterium luteifluviistationis]|uniref:T9SS C-terminal target domain-containing protein n=1 Tax=Arcticibacterium luteifluviistationis TaxID=1784714 RepID=A0A2Z4GGS8_9BACT|nr:T9SS type A sorting domain-containing protein [Arcticibacterium luteifluviistationis]AWW00491.1 T9SS C-terminal target domain-containing protein [Arcticibacterium luteifluviistationis]